MGKSSLFHKRCEISVYFWGAVFLSFLINWFKLNESSWLAGFLISIGLIFISFSIAYEFIKLISHSKVLSAIFIKPIYIFQYLTCDQPDSKHLKLGEAAFNELLRLEKETK